MIAKLFNTAARPAVARAVKQRLRISWGGAASTPARVSGAAGSCLAGGLARASRFRLKNVVELGPTLFERGQNQICF